MFHWNLEDGSGVELTPPEDWIRIWQLWQPYDIERIILSGVYILQGSTWFYMVPHGSTWFYHVLTCSNMFLPLFSLCKWQLDLEQDFLNCCIRSLKAEWNEKRLAITGNDDGCWAFNCFQIDSTFAP